MKTFYAIQLSSSRGANNVTRWQLYTIKDGQLEVVWPVDSHEGKKAKRLPNQVYSENKNFPAWHFLMKGIGTSHIFEIAMDLAHHFGESVAIQKIAGSQPEETIARIGGGK